MMCRMEDENIFTCCRWCFNADVLKRNKHQKSSWSYVQCSLLLKIPFPIQSCHTLIKKKFPVFSFFFLFWLSNNIYSTTTIKRYVTSDQLHYTRNNPIPIPNSPPQSLLLKSRDHRNIPPQSWCLV